MVIAIASSQGLELAIKNTIIDAESAIKISSINSKKDMEPIVLTPEEIEVVLDIEGVKSIHPVIYKPCIITIDNSIQGVILKGVNSSYKHELLNKSIIDGKYMEKENELLVSIKQSKTLNLSIGQTCILYFLSKNQNIQKRKFIISGVYDLGNEKFNEFHVFAQQKSLQKINKWNDEQVTNYEIELDAITQLENIENKINNKLDYDLFAQSITNRFPGIFSWINLFNKNMILIITIMCIICLINMTSALLILVLERLKMIGILKSYGCSNYSILKLFLYSSIKISTQGIILGNIIGFTLCLIQQKTHIITLNPTSYFVNYLPISLNLDFIILVNIIIFVVIQISILMPYYVIKKISPSNILKIK